MNVMTMRPRLVTIALLLSVGALGAVGYAVTRDDSRPATRAGDGDSSGTGTVQAQPSAAPSATPTASPSTAAPTGGDATGTGGGPVRGDGGSGGGAGGNGNGPSGTFTIAGSVTGLLPGAQRTMALTVTNTNPWPIQVLTLDTQVGTADRLPCAGLSVGRYAYSSGDAVVRVAARSSAQVSVPVLLVDSLTQDQSACPSATFPLAFSGTAQMVAGR